jgi:hypothetical protein
VRRRREHVTGFADLFVSRRSDTASTASIVTSISLVFVVTSRAAHPRSGYEPLRADAEAAYPAEPHGNSTLGAINPRQLMRSGASYFEHVDCTGELNQGRDFVGGGDRLVSVFVHRVGVVGALDPDLVNRFVSHAAPRSGLDLDGRVITPMREGGDHRPIGVLPYASVSTRAS